MSVQNDGIVQAPKQTQEPEAAPAKPKVFTLRMPDCMRQAVDALVGQVVEPLDDAERAAQFAVRDFAGHGIDRLPIQ